MFSSRAHHLARLLINNLLSPGGGGDQLRSKWVALRRRICLFPLGRYLPKGVLPLGRFGLVPLLCCCLCLIILMSQLSSVWQLAEPPLPLTRDVFIYASFVYENSTSLSSTPSDSLAVLMLANRDDDFPWVRCAHHKRGRRRLVPALLSRVDYVGICQLIIFIAWCQFPPGTISTKSRRPRGAYLDLGTQVLADNALREKYTRPILHRIQPLRADREPRQLVMCISRIFAFEKWELLIAAMEVYKSLGVDLVVTHIYSVITPVFELIRAYESEGRLTIRKGVKLPVLPTMNFDPDRQLEYSGQLAMAHECFYEFRASSEFISLVDWDDLVISTGFPSLPAALHAAARQYPRAAYFYMNKLESGIVRREGEVRSPSGFRVDKMLSNTVFTKRVYNSEKMMIRPSRVDSFWVHFSRGIVRKQRPAQLPVRFAAILHLSRELDGTESEYRHNVLGSLNNSAQILDQAHRFFSNWTVSQILLALPSRLHYFGSIRHCSLFINAYPDLHSPSPCLSYSLCPFPRRLRIPCTVARTRFRSTTIRPARVYRVHTRLWSRFEHTRRGCF